MQFNYTSYVIDDLIKKFVFYVCIPLAIYIKNSQIIFMFKETKYLNI